jgi:hypothetical protein
MATPSRGSSPAQLRPPRGDRARAPHERRALWPSLASVKDGDNLAAFGLISTSARCSPAQRVAIGISLIAGVVLLKPTLQAALIGRSAGGHVALLSAYADRESSPARSSVSWRPRRGSGASSQRPSLCCRAADWHAPCLLEDHWPSPSSCQFARDAAFAAISLGIRAPEATQVGAIARSSLQGQLRPSRRFQPHWEVARQCRVSWHERRASLYEHWGPELAGSGDFSRRNAARGVREADGPGAGRGPGF